MPKGGRPSITDGRTCPCGVSRAIPTSSAKVSYLSVSYRLPPADFGAGKPRQTAPKHISPKLFLFIVKYLSVDVFVVKPRVAPRIEAESQHVACGFLGDQYQINVPTRRRQRSLTSSALPRLTFVGWYPLACSAGAISRKIATPAAFGLPRSAKEGAGTRNCIPPRRIGAPISNPRWRQDLRDRDMADPAALRLPNFGRISVQIRSSR